MAEADPSSLESRIEAIELRLVAACQRGGRERAEVALICVSKKRTPEQITEAFGTGLALFGENRVQEGRIKIPLCPGGATWHLIGHLQTNKVRQAVELFSMIHGVDSLRLLTAIDAAAGDAGRVVDVCLQVNVSGEGAKYGLAPSEVESVLVSAQSLFNVNVVGLMTMAPFSPEPEDARPHFCGLRELRDQLRVATGFPLEELSMGMSGDFEVAIEEGATLVRIGSAIFDETSQG